MTRCVRIARVPGRQSNIECCVRWWTPGLDKAAVRRIARALALPSADKPAAPCLASRIPHFQAGDTGKAASD